MVYGRLWFWILRGIRAVVRIVENESVRWMSDPLSRASHYELGIPHDKASVLHCKIDWACTELLLHSMESQLTCWHHSRLLFSAMAWLLHSPYGVLSLHFQQTWSRFDSNMWGTCVLLPFSLQRSAIDWTMECIMDLSVPHSSPKKAQLWVLKRAWNSKKTLMLI